MTPVFVLIAVVFIAYVIVLVGGFAYELTDDIDATLQLNYDYETEPAPGFDNDDLQYLIGVKVELD